MTSNEVAQRDDNHAELDLPVYASPLLTWLEEARLTHQIAQSLAKTSFVPASLQGKPHDITAAILAGAELGLRPMATLRSVDVIFGVPALRAHAMRGLLQSHGHQIEVLESTDTVCRVRGRRCIVRPNMLNKDGKYEQWQEAVWTIERANRMGLPQRKSRDPKKADQPNQWQLQPQTMLIARATGEICRLIASDVLYAMPYASEEIDHDERPAIAPQRRVTAAEILGHPDPEPAPQPDNDWPEVPAPGSGQVPEGGTS